MADRALNIAVDGRELLGNRTGVGRYVLSILHAWSLAPAGHRIRVFLPEEPTDSLRAALPAISWQVEKGAGSGTRWEQMRLPRALARAQPDVLFAPAYTAPIRLPCPMVVTIHDVSFFAHPEWFGRREGWRRRWLTRATARRATTVLTVSEFSRSEIQRYLRIPANRIVIASPGAPARARGAKPEGPPVLLYVGSLFNRRRIGDLIRAFALAASRVPDARLILAGDNRTSPRIDPRQIAADTGVGSCVEWREYVDDSTLDELYRTARGFVFLSEYEGFGMPPLEALAHGLPPLVLDTPVSREVYGEAALRVGLDLPAIADAMTRLLTDQELRRRLVAEGERRLAALSWDQTAAVVRRTLEDAAR